MFGYAINEEQSCEDYIILVGLSKIIQGENPECLEVELKSYLGILCADKILA